MLGKGHLGFMGLLLGEATEELGWKEPCLLPAGGVQKPLPLSLRSPRFGSRGREGAALRPRATGHGPRDRELPAHLRRQACSSELTRFSTNVQEAWPWPRFELTEEFLPPKCVPALTPQTSPGYIFRILQGVVGAIQNQQDTTVLLKNHREERSSVRVRDPQIYGGGE